MVADRRETRGRSNLDIGVQDHITEDTYLGRRLISDAKPCSRHMTGMSINMQTSGLTGLAAPASYMAKITVYPYINETIVSGGTAYEGGAVHIIDTMSESAGAEFCYTLLTDRRSETRRRRARCPAENYPYGGGERWRCAAHPAHNRHVEFSREAPRSSEYDTYIDPQNSQIV